MPALLPARPRAPAPGPLLPFALAGATFVLTGAALAQQSAPPPGAWVDPPARPAAARSEPVASSQPRDAAKTAAPADDTLPKAASARAAAPRRALALERPTGREVPGEPAARPRRAATPAALTAPDASGRAAAARDLATRYLAAVSAPGTAMVGAAPGFYAARVRFYGRPTTLAGLVAEKRSFVRRWPERRYEPRAIQAACDARTCTVRAVVDFRAASPGRGAVSSGAAELVLEVDVSGPRPVIVAETGRVLRRGAQAAALAPSPGKA